ncbi:restriction endonuclease [Saccharothrix australiensis]|uniref:Restriction system protein n=1 Tax=Saccharothrix australiensis TaxID=2072 RepID=A0A495W1H5_9PSEU|nr:restriction endonuclease [Saccharothrix australiensis]RKT54867.1 restriction system protein [Saccharothrix australiensis]
MPKKKRRARKKSSNGVVGALVFVGALAALQLARVVADNPVPFVVAGSSAACAAAAVGVWWVRRRLARARLQAERDRVITSTDGMSGRDFEHWTARLLRRSGCTDVEVVGRAGDAGADVVARSPHGGRVVVQCKRYDHLATKVGSPDVQRFAGTARHVHHADHALLITTTGYTRPARDLAATVGITLVDRDLLAEWARTGVAPPSTGIGRPAVDEHHGARGQT